MRIAMIALMLLAVNKSAEARPSWPEISPISREILVDENHSIGVDLNIKKVNSEEILYELKCHPEGYPDSTFDYSGLMQCYLIDKRSAESLSNLLDSHANATSDWENRGRFLSTHIQPPCGFYPEFGANRTFRLRGMLITLNLQPSYDAKSPGERSFQFKVAVVPLSKARSARAELPHAREPSWFYLNRCPSKIHGVR